LPELRDKIAGTARPRGLIQTSTSFDIAEPSQVVGSIFLRARFPGRMQAKYEEGFVPYVQVTWVEGRTPEQKRKLAERITQVLIEDGKAKRENIQVTFVDLPATDYAEAGITVADQKRTP
jgi:4-oxalocrotonate tautomerase